MTDTELKFSFDIIVLGDPGVGVSSLCNAFSKSDTYEKGQSLRDVLEGKVSKNRMFESKAGIVTLEGGEIVKLTLWHLSKEAKYATLNRDFYQKGSHALIVYDVTNPESYENISLWSTEICKYTSDTTISLVGNKIDERDNVAGSMTLSDAKENAAVPGRKIYEVSAKKQTGFDILFKTIAAECVARAKRSTAQRRQRQGRACAIL